MVVSAKSGFNRIKKVALIVLKNVLVDVFRNEGCKYWKLAGYGN